MSNKKVIGVFDSGVGGLSVTNAIKKALPENEVIYVEDAKNVPYGTKNKEELYGLVLPILKKLEKITDVIVVACNTVTTLMISDLRKEIRVPLVGMEPMIKTAAENTKSNIVAVCATPATLNSDRYAYLKDTYANNVKVLEPDCSDWSYLIESNEINKSHISKIVEDVCTEGADVIVLGCTHYHWIESEIVELSKGRAKVLQPELSVISQLEVVLKQLA